MSKRERKLTLYALIYSGCRGPIHSIDYPKVWHTGVGAKRYMKEVVPEVKRSIYQIVKFVAERP